MDAFFSISGRPILTAIVLLATMQRIGEMLYARHNTRCLLAAGAWEVGGGHYPLIVLLHAAWLAGLWYNLLSGSASPHPWPGALYLLVQGLRVWVMVSLGRYWTTRVIIRPAGRLVRHGPYRFCRHPNYVVVALEVALLPLALGLWRYALFFSAVNAALLVWRVRVEELALSPYRK